MSQLDGDLRRPEETIFRNCFDSNLTATPLLINRRTPSNPARMIQIIFHLESGKPMKYRERVSKQSNTSVTRLFLTGLVRRDSLIANEISGMCVKTNKTIIPD